MKKRIVAVILLLTMLFSMLTACKCSSEKSGIIKGEWLLLLEKGFTMEGYSSDEPYIKSVEKGNKYFDAVQIAYEWDIIDDSFEKVDESISVKEATLTIVKAVNEIDTQDKDTEDIIDYAKEKGYMTVDLSLTNLNNGLSQEDAEACVANAKEKWKSQTFEKECNIKYKQNVVNLENAYSTEKSSFQFSGNTLIMPKKYGEGIKAGSIYVVPGNGAYGEVIVKKAESVSDDGTNIKIVNSNETLKLEDVVEDYHFSNTETVNFSTTPILDMNGNVISKTEETPLTPTANNNTENKVKNMVLNSNIENCDFGTASLDFETEGLKIKAKCDEDKLSFSVKGEIKSFRNDSIKITVGDEVELSNFKISHSFSDENGYAKGYLKSSYDLNFKKSLAVKWGNYNKKDKKDGISAKDLAQNDIKKIINILGVSSEDLEKSAVKTVELFKFPVAATLGTGVYFVVQLKVSIEGKVEVVVTTENVNGFSYRKNKLGLYKFNPINEKKETKKDVSLGVTIEAVFPIGISVKLAGFDLITVAFSGGVGATAVGTMHVYVTNSSGSMSLANSVTFEENPELIGTCAENTKIIDGAVKFCVDVKVYGIIRVGVSDQGVIGKFFKGLEFEIFGKDNAELFKLHLEDGKKVPECTRVKSTMISDDGEKVKNNIQNISPDEMPDSLKTFLNGFLASYHFGKAYAIYSDPKLYEYNCNDLNVGDAYEGLIFVPMDCSFLHEPFNWGEYKIERDPLNKLGSSKKVKKDDAIWILQNVFNVSKSDAEAVIKKCVAFNNNKNSYEYEENGITYIYTVDFMQHVDHYNRTVEIKDVKYDGNKYMIQFNDVGPGKPEGEGIVDNKCYAEYNNCYAEVAEKDYNGKKYWSLYTLTDKSNE